MNARNYIFKQETCMACDTVGEVRHIKVGRIALLCCESCEDKLHLLIEFIREKSRKAMKEKKGGEESVMVFQRSLYDVS